MYEKNNTKEVGKELTFYYRQDLKRQTEGKKLGRAIHLLFKDSIKLYNKALQLQKAAVLKRAYIKWPDMVEKLRREPLFILLGEPISKSIIRNLDVNYKNYFNNNQQSKNLSEPSYRNKNSEFFVAFFYIRSYLKDGKKYINIPLTNNFKKKHGLENEDLIFAVPENYFKRSGNNGPIFQMRLHSSIHQPYVVYHYKKPISVIRQVKQSNKVMGIDLGVDNLVTAFVTDRGRQYDSDNSLYPFILKGGHIKFINYKFFYREGSQNWSKRKNKIDSYFNDVIKYIEKYCLKFDVSTVVCGFFKDIKKVHKNFGFFYIPFLAIRRKLQNSLEKRGIKVLFTEESYTSKCSAYTRENLGENFVFLGEREKRGLFSQSIKKNGEYFKQSWNCDLNGAANIIRKKFYLKDVHTQNVIKNPKVLKKRIKGQKRN